MKLKFVPFYSLSEVLLHGMSFFRCQKCQFLAENHGLRIVHGFDRIYFDIYNSSLKKAIELTFVQFCSS